MSILKPLCGADAGLRENLRIFFEQDHPQIELLFGAQSAADPAIAVVRDLKGHYPDVSCRLVVHTGGQAINPKVKNLAGMWPLAKHDLVLISDSNIRAPKNYVQELLRTYLADDDIQLATNLFAGSGETGLGSMLENVQLNGFCSAGTCLPTTLGHAAVIGKSMLLSRSLFESMGGLSRVANLLAEDFVIGKMFQHGGHRVAIAPTVLSNVTSGTTIRGFMGRHLRWAMLRSRVKPAAFLLEPLTSPLALLPLALTLRGQWGFSWVISALLLRDVGGWLALRGAQRLWIPALLAPICELLVFLVWLGAPMKRHVTWRGNRVRVAAGSLLFSRGSWVHSAGPAATHNSVAAASPMGSEQRSTLSSTMKRPQTTACTLDELASIC